MKEYAVVSAGPTWTKHFFVPYPTEPDVLSVKTWVVFSPSQVNTGLMIKVRYKDYSSPSMTALSIAARAKSKAPTSVSTWRKPLT